MKRMKNGWTVCLAVFLTAVVSCNKQQPPGQQQAESRQPTNIQGTVQNAVAGIRWSVPGRWVQQPVRQMRAATYTVPAAHGDVEGGECAVFYFGGDQGGDVEANIARWVGQFENPDKPERSTEAVGSLKVSLVKVAGTFLAPGGPMMQSQGKKENFRLLGAIVEAPQGSVFFKFTGPANTVAAAEEEFGELIESLVPDR